MSNDTLQDVRDALAPAGVLNPLLTAYAGVIPSTATPFGAANTVAIDGTTPRAIRAAVTSKKKWITKIVFVNGTQAENPVLVVQDDTGTPVRHAVGAPGGILTTTSGAAGHSPQTEIVCNPPIEVAAGKAINGRAIASCTGAFITVMGYEEA